MRQPVQRRKRGDQTVLKSALKEGSDEIIPSAVGGTGTGAWGSNISHAPIMSVASITSGTSYTNQNHLAALGLANSAVSQMQLAASQQNALGSYGMQMYRPGEYQPVQAPYVPVEYPKHLHQPDGNFIVVCSELEERTVRASGVLLID